MSDFINTYNMEYKPTKYNKWSHIIRDAIDFTQIGNNVTNRMLNGRNDLFLIGAYVWAYGYNDDGYVWLVFGKIKSKDNDLYTIDDCYVPQFVNGVTDWSEHKQIVCDSNHIVPVYSIWLKTTQSQSIKFKTEQDLIEAIITIHPLFRDFIDDEDKRCPLLNFVNERVHEYREQCIRHNCTGGYIDIVSNAFNVPVCVLVVNEPVLNVNKIIDYTDVIMYKYRRPLTRFKKKIIKYKKKTLDKHSNVWYNIYRKGDRVVWKIFIFG